MTAATVSATGTPVASPTRSDSRLRARALFAAAFGVLVLVESYITFWNAVPADLRLYYFWRAAYWSSIDVALWWVCVSAADATPAGRTLGVRPYVLAAIAASATAPILHWATQTWYFEPTPSGIAPIPPFLVWWMVVIVGAWRITLLTAAYYYRLRSVADDALLARARLDRAMLSRKAVESQLQALQGKVDPDLLFETLDDIEQACEWDAARADRMLDCLIAFLRSALPHDDDGARTVAHETALASAFLALAQARQDDLSYSLDAADDALPAAIAPMLLTPLVAQAVRALRGAAGSVSVGVLLEGRELRIVISTRGTEAQAVWQRAGEVAEVARRLDDVYAGAGSLAVGAAGTDDMQIILRIPHEHATRRHR